MTGAPGKKDSHGFSTFSSAAFITTTADEGAVQGAGDKPDKTKVG